MNAPERRTDAAVWMALTVIAAAGAGLRLTAAGGALWFDEVWSIEQLAMVLASDSWRDRWALLFHDNTHLLNTLWLLVLGPDASALAYRALAIASGTLGIVFAFLISNRRGPAEGLLSALLLALSYPLVHYGGEARGYAPMMAAALAAFWVAELWLDRPTAVRAAAFILGQIMMIAEFLNSGRGDFEATFREIDKRSAGPARIAAHHGTSVDVLLAWWQRRTEAGGGLRFVPDEADRRDPAGWYVANGGRGEPAPPVLDRRLAGGLLARYERLGVYGHWGFSGDTWAVYRRLD